MFVNKYGGLYLNYGVQDTRVDPVKFVVPVEGRRGLAMNHNLGFYANEDALTGSLHVHVAVDHLTGVISPVEPGAAS